MNRRPCGSSGSLSLVRRAALLTFAGLGLFVLSSCGSKSPDALIDAGKGDLAAGSYDSALASFQEAEELLRGAEGSDVVEKQRYRARLGVVEAKTKLKDGEGAHNEFALLAADYPKEVDWKVYRKVAEDLRSHGCGPEAIKVLNAAEKAFPEKKDEFLAVIESIKATAGEGSAELEALRALGYVQ